MLRAGRNTLRADEQGRGRLYALQRIPSRERANVLRVRSVQVGEGHGDSVQHTDRPGTYAAKVKAPICPVCKEKAQLVSRDELFPFREDNKKLADAYYVCCGKFAAANPKTLSRAEPFQGYLDRRLRGEARRALTQLTRAVFGYGFVTPVASAKARHFVASQLHLGTDIHISAADADTCRAVILVCHDRLRQFGKRGYTWS